MNTTDPRARLGRLATIKLGIGMKPRYVLVTNASEEGVRLQLNGIGTTNSCCCFTATAARPGTAPTK